MKTPLTLLFLLLAVCATAQDTRNCALFKEGTRLEYKTYLYVAGPTVKTPTKLETTRIIIIVDSVKENDGVLSTYITKKGIASRNPKYKYTKNFIIKSDGKRIILPYVLYMPDTTYACDVVQWQGGGLFSLIESERRRAGVYSGTDYPVNGL